MPLDQRRAPLLDAVRGEARRAGLRLHTPAHQGAVDESFADLMGQAIAADLTELDSTDDLRDPEGVIAEAEALAAEHWGADRTFFLVGGASLGNQAALIACASRASHLPGEGFQSCEGNSNTVDSESWTKVRPKVVIGRNAHVSAISGLVLAGLEPIWVPAPWDAEWGVARPPAAGAFEAALAEHPDAVAVFATTPSYYGEAGDVAALRAVVGERLLVVDEAHGAHLPRAIAAGADLVVHSAHKGLSGPTQGGYLHVRGRRIDLAVVAAAIRMLQTTSPNYWILAGLDAARRDAALATWGPARRPALPEKTTSPGKEEIHRGEMTTLLGDLAGLPGGIARKVDPSLLDGLTVRPSDDPGRILVRFADGPAAYEALASRGLVAEAALPGAVLLLLGHGSRDAGDRIAELLVEVAGLFADAPAPVPAPPRLPEKVCSPREAALAASSLVPLEQAEGRICAEPVCPYPPGIPVLVPGERVEPGALAHLTAVASGIRHIRVVD